MAFETVNIPSTSGTLVSFNKAPDAEIEIGTVESYADGKYQIKIGDEDSFEIVEVGEDTVTEIKLAPAVQNRSLFNRIGR
ncbi:hypothetical protein TWF481_005217 [Arthrobotrys musiformis]|uniref:Uncharacterized protein n=1 Tax=Arthrobotrys musiformis TaxID=47236 RepID=A0AAV9WD43_9PEZI